MADDGRVALEHFLDLDLTAPDEGELLRNRALGPHPKVSLVGDKRSRDESPAADELVIDETRVDLAEFVAVVQSEIGNGTVSILCIANLDFWDDPED